MIKQIFCIGLALVMHVSAFACEYNVRDVGFVDLGVSPYQFYVFVDKSTDDAQREMIDDSLFMGLLDANIAAKLVEVGSDHEALTLIKEHVPDAYPAGVLVSPKGFHKAIPLAESVKAGSDAFEAQLQTLSTSEFRTALLKQVTKNYGVVFIIEGPDTEENTAVTDAAMRAVRKIHTRMKMLPKTISNPPVVMTLSRDQFEEESLLLWSYGLKPTTVDKAHVVILYGRGRQMGPVLTEDAITEERITSYLQVIGADCECGLDRSWMQGTMIPLLWSAEIQDEVSVSLGFDPENPRTKMEISMTVAKGQTNRVNGGSDTKNPDSVDKISFAYNEDAVTFMDEGEDPPLVLSDGEAEIEQLSDSLYDGDASRATGSEDASVVPTEETDAKIPIPWWVIIGALVTAVIIIASLAVMVGAFKRE